MRKAGEGKGQGSGVVWAGGGVGEASGRSLARSPASPPSLQLPALGSASCVGGEGTKRRRRGGRGGQAEEAGWRPAGVEIAGSCTAAAFWYFLPPAPAEAMINRTVGKEASCGCLRARLEPLEKKRGREGGRGGEEDGERKKEAAQLPPAAAPCEERRAGGEPAGGARSAACQLTDALFRFVCFWFLFVCFLSPPSVGFLPGGLPMS